MILKIAIRVIILLLVTQIGFAQSNSESITVILLRHSEKVADGSKNPDLTERGKNYAQSLAKLFSEVKFDAAFSTPYTRTQETIGVLVKGQSIPLYEYPPLDMKNILKVVGEKGYKTIIVSGHSNTVPFLVNDLVPSAKLEELDESDYGKIYIVKYFKGMPEISSFMVLNTVEFLN